MIEVGVPTAVRALAGKPVEDLTVTLRYPGDFVLLPSSHLATSNWSFVGREGSAEDLGGEGDPGSVDPASRWGAALFGAQCLGPVVLLR